MVDFELCGLALVRCRVARLRSSLAGYVSTIGIQFPAVCTLHEYCAVMLW